ncbi:hypothetical protein [Escherichia coli]|uniref:hypothetical protein n=1 Tax=Escherichia coli TaxID=562 RepID=UPI000452465E|nr:hypothetical protein [Escherichia coli]EER9146668.1 hypothetical protein [Escherichia coli]EEU2029688.1 hypothetical protein [Escherichia coli]EFE8774982.1 hypothetical protein [Escherichia coli]EFF7899101.1 hypothetical protein [Escherichia coli]EFG0190784.1 hypothetical protein [Escherichia coli]
MDNTRHTSQSENKTDDLTAYERHFVEKKQAIKRHIEEMDIRKRFEKSSSINFALKDFLKQHSSRPDNKG